MQLCIEVKIHIFIYSMFIAAYLIQTLRYVRIVVAYT